MQHTAKIEWVGDRVREFQSRGGPMRSVKIAVRFNDGPPEGLPASAYQESGSILGEIAFKTKAPVVGEYCELEPQVRQFPSGDSYVAFKRVKPAVSAGNGHAKPAPSAMPTSPTIPSADRASALEFWARCEVMLDLILDTTRRLEPDASADHRLDVSQRLLTTFVIRWLDTDGCQMPMLAAAAMRGYKEGTDPSPDGDEDAIPF